MTQMRSSASNRQWPDLRSALLEMTSKSATLIHVSRKEDCADRKCLLSASTNFWTMPTPCGARRRMTAGGMFGQPMTLLSSYASTSLLYSVPVWKSHSGDSPRAGLQTTRGGEGGWGGTAD